MEDWSLKSVVKRFIQYASKHSENPNAIRTVTVHLAIYAEKIQLRNSEDKMFFWHSLDSIFLKFKYTDTGFDQRFHDTADLVRRKLKLTADEMFPQRIKKTGQEQLKIFPDIVHKQRPLRGGLELK